jgi:hypothetical protein
VSAGSFISLMLRENGTVHGVGANHHDCNPPAGVAGPFVAIAAGSCVCVGLFANGDILHWGSIGGQGQPPAGVIKGPFHAITAGWLYTLALREDGSARAFGSYDNGGTNAVEDRPGPFLALSAGTRHCLALRSSDNTLEAWGDNTHGQTDCPSGAFIACAAGDYHSIALRPSGEVVGWGDNSNGQCATIQGAKRFALPAAAVAPLVPPPL